MFEILSGKAHFWQWDTNQKLLVKDETINEVHFCNGATACALVCKVYEENGQRVVDVPNILFWYYWNIKVYAVCDNCTRLEAVFEVRKRSKPDDYAYTETEIKRYEDLEQRIEALEKNGGASVDLSDYYTKTETEERIASVANSLEERVDFKLGSYALTSDLEEAISNIDIPDVSAYQTEEQVVALIQANIPASGDEVSY